MNRRNGGLSLSLSLHPSFSLSSPLLARCRLSGIGERGGGRAPSICSLAPSSKSSSLSWLLLVVSGVSITATRSLCHPADSSVYAEDRTDTRASATCGPVCLRHGPSTFICVFTTVYYWHSLRPGPWPDTNTAHSVCSNRQPPGPPVQAPVTAISTTSAADIWAWGCQRRQPRPSDHHVAGLGYGHHREDNIMGLGEE